MNRTRTLSRWLLLPAAALVAAAGIACGAEDEPAATSPTAVAPTSAAATAAAASTKTTYPLTVTDMLNRSVQVAKKPERVIGLSPTAVELVYSAGGVVVGRASSATYPASVTSIAEVGTAYQPSVEKILALKPDLLVADATIQAQPQLRQLIEGVGVPVVFAGAESYDGVLTAMKLVGRVLDGQEKTNAAIADIDKAMAEAKAAVGAKNVSAVALIADRDRSLYAAKANSYAGDVFTKAGIKNPAATEPDSGPFPGFTAVSTETLLKYNPTIIFTLTPAPEPAPRLSATLPMIPPFAGLGAVRNKQVIEANVEVMLQSPGPRLADAFRAVAKAVAALPAS